MIRVLGFALLCFVAIAPSEVMGQKKGANKKSDAADATPDQYAMLAKYKEMVGTIRSTTATSIVLRVDYTPPGAAATPPPNITARTARSQIQQMQRAQQKAVQDLQAKSKNGKEHIDFELPLTDKATVRRLHLGVEYDDKGNPKDQKAAAKGEGGLPGFAAKIDDLNTGDHVKVYLVAPSKAAPKKDADGALIDGQLPGHPQVRMIVLLEDANAAAAPNNKKKK